MAGELNSKSLVPPGTQSIMKSKTETMLDKLLMVVRIHEGGGFGNI